MGLEKCYIFTHFIVVNLDRYEGNLHTDLEDTDTAIRGRGQRLLMRASLVALTDMIVLVLIMC